MLKGLPTRLNLLTENASEWNVFAFYPSLHWEVLHSSSFSSFLLPPELRLGLHHPPLLFLPWRSGTEFFHPMWLPFHHHHHHHQISRSTLCLFHPFALLFPTLSPFLPLSFFASRRTSRHICSTLKKWLTIEIPRSWCVLAHSGYWWKVKFFRSISSSGYHWKDGVTGIFIGRQSVRLIKHCKFKCRESIGRINSKLCEYFSPLLAIEQFPGTASKRSSDLVVSEILRSRYPSMYSSSKISWYVTGFDAQFRYATVEIHESSSSRHSS